MEKLTRSQLKSLSEFANAVAAAWFSAGVIAPFFTRSKTIFEALIFPLAGLLATSITLILSLKIIRNIEI